MPEIRFPHEPYLGAVAAALDAAGLKVASWEPDVDEIYSGWVVLDRALTTQAYGPDIEVDLLWHEERGWSVGWGAEVDQVGFDQVVYLDLGGVLPTPAEVVDAARAVTVAMPVTQPASHVPAHVIYRDAYADDGFLKQLATYVRWVA